MVTAKMVTAAGVLVESVKVHGVNVSSLHVSLKMFQAWIVNVEKLLQRTQWRKGGESASKHVDNIKNSTQTELPLCVCVCV